MERGLSSRDPLRIWLLISFQRVTSLKNTVYAGTVAPKNPTEAAAKVPNTGTQTGTSTGTGGTKTADTPKNTVAVAPPPRNDVNQKTVAPMSVNQTTQNMTVRVDNKVSVMQPTVALPASSNQPLGHSVKQEGKGKTEKERRDDEKERGGKEKEEKREKQKTEKTIGVSEKQLGKVRGRGEREREI